MIGADAAAPRRRIPERIKPCHPLTAGNAVSPSGERREQDAELVKRRGDDCLAEQMRLAQKR
jgi:hypothetical protein